MVEEEQLDPDHDRAKFDQLDKGRCGNRQDKAGVELLQWLLTNGAQFPDLFLREYAPEVRGVHAQRALVPNTCILRIPLECLITVEMGKRTDIGKKLIENHISFVAPKHIFLMMFLLTDWEQASCFD